MQLKNPQWLELQSGGRTLYGLSQRWYSTHWKRTAGCGPTAATMLLLYMNRREGGPLPYKADTAIAAVAAMEDVWRFVTPGLMGLNSTEKFVQGTRNLAGRYGVPWSCHELRVERNGPIEDIGTFVEHGLQSDCPVAFLNLHAGSITRFESWHWIVLTALNREGDRYLATGCDGTAKIGFDLAEWAATTKMGGGFAYLTAEQP